MEKRCVELDLTARPCGSSARRASHERPPGQAVIIHRDLDTFLLDCHQRPLMAQDAPAKEAEPIRWGRL